MYQKNHAKGIFVHSLKGILFSFGSIFLNMYAKEFPSAITKLTDSFKILTGQASNAMSKL